MTRIIAYTYEADYHCPECTRKRFYGLPGCQVDENGVCSGNVRDNEGNPIHPVFSTDDTPPSTSCSDCHAVITEPFHEQVLNAMEADTVKNIAANLEAFGRVSAAVHSGAANYIQQSVRGDRFYREKAREGSYHDTGSDACLRPGMRRAAADQLYEALKQCVVALANYENMDCEKGHAHSAGIQALCLADGIK